MFSQMAIKESWFVIYIRAFMVLNRHQDSGTQNFPTVGFKMVSSNLKLIIPYSPKVLAPPLWHCLSMLMT